MVALYVRMIEEGRWTLDKVPKKFGWYDETKEQLIEDGYLNEDGTEKDQETQE